MPDIRRVNSRHHEDGGKQHGEPQRRVTQCDRTGDQDRDRTPDNPVVGRDDRKAFAQSGQHGDNDQHNERDNAPGFLAARPGKARPHQRGGDHQKRIFRGPRKDVGGDQARKNPAEHAAQRHAEIEPREPGPLRPRRGHQAVAYHRRDEERQQMQRDVDDQPGADIERERQHEQGEQERLHRDPGGLLDKDAPAEHQDEADQIERQRKYPEKGRGGHIGRDVGGCRDHQRRRHEGKHHPIGHAAERRGGFRRLRLRQGRLAAAAEEHQASAQRDQCDQQVIAGTPDAALEAECRKRFGNERIGKQRQQASDIARRVEEIGIFGLSKTGAGEPRLQQRPVGGQREEGKADGSDEQTEQEQLLAVGRRQAPAFRNGDRQENRSPQHDREVDQQGERAAYKAGKNVGIGVAQQQDALEEHHGHGPHRRRAAEPRQHHFREHGLHGEQKRRAEENSRGIDRNQQGRRTVGFDGRGFNPIAHRHTRSTLLIRSTDLFATE